MSQISLETPQPAPRSDGDAPAAISRALARRREQTSLLADAIPELVAACDALAARIAAGGRLFVLATGRERADARHLALEFLHPVIVGKRAVSAVALDPREDPRALEIGAAPGDAAIAVIGPDPAPEVWRMLDAARARGLLAFALDPRASDARLCKEGHVVTYHLLWELTHVLLEGAERVGAPDATWSQLYPFLGEGGASRESVRDDACRSGVAKLRALTALREAAVNDQAARIVRCADAIGAALHEGGQLWTFGNGGSQTDAEWLAGCFAGARSLASDPSVLTALANDVGFERVFARQVAAFARAGDVALGISTSGSSENVAAGIAEARRRGLITIALVGGDGGRLARSGDVDYLLVVPSDSVHRIQEVQATFYHLLQELACAS